MKYRILNGGKIKKLLGQVLYVLGLPNKPFSTRPINFLVRQMFVRSDKNLKSTECQATFPVLLGSLYWVHIFAPCGQGQYAVIGSIYLHPVARDNMQLLGPYICTLWPETIACYWVHIFAPCGQRQYAVIGSIYLHPVARDNTQLLGPFICTLWPETIVSFW
jgi:hypothetical protein